MHGETIKILHAMFLPSTSRKFLCFQSSFLTRVKFLVLLCLYKSSKLIEFTNFWNRYKCLFTSSLFLSGHLPPSIIIPFLRVSLCLFRMEHSLIKCSELRGSVKGTGYPLHSPVSPSLPQPCVTVCHHISAGV